MKTLTLTDGQASTLRMVLLLTTQYREKEIDAWENLSKELKDDGTPKYPHAAGNANWWRKENATISEILELL
jgi:hypothetical protein